MRHYPARWVVDTRCDPDMRRAGVADSGCLLEELASLAYTPDTRSHPSRRESPMHTTKLATSLLVLLAVVVSAVPVQAETVNCTAITSLPAVITVQGVY